MVFLSGGRASLNDELELTEEVADEVKDPYVDGKAEKEPKESERELDQNDNLQVANQLLARVNKVLTQKVIRRCQFLVIKMKEMVQIGRRLNMID
jgi:hypothetical protein